MKSFLNLFLIFTSILLSACVQSEYTTTQHRLPHYASKVKNTKINDPAADASGTMLAYNRRFSDEVGRYSMDSSDKSKLSHALDNPIGKATTWTNESSNITYTVTPTKKVTINGNSFCREYSLSENRHGRIHESYGTACVDKKSSKWQAATKPDWRSRQPQYPHRWGSGWGSYGSGWSTYRQTYTDY